MDRSQLLFGPPTCAFMTSTGAAWHPSFRLGTCDFTLRLPGWRYASAAVMFDGAYRLRTPVAVERCLTHVYCLLYLSLARLARTHA